MSYPTVPPTVPRPSAAPEIGSLSDFSRRTCPSSKPVRRGSPTLGRFDSYAAPSVARRRPATGEGRSTRPSWCLAEGEGLASGVDRAATHQRGEPGVLRRVGEGVIERVEPLVARRREIEELPRAQVTYQNRQPVRQAAPEQRHLDAVAGAVSKFSGVCGCHRKSPWSVVAAHSHQPKSSPVRRAGVSRYGCPYHGGD